VTNFAASIHQSSRLCDPESAELAAPDGIPKITTPHENCRNDRSAPGPGSQPLLLRAILFD
jgi:hypothetical protein